MFVDSPGPLSETVLTSGLEATVVLPDAAGLGQLTVSAFDRITFARAAVLGISERQVPLEVAP